MDFMKMKKIGRRAACLCATVLVLALCACGKSETDIEEPKSEPVSAEDYRALLAERMDGRELSSLSGEDLTYVESLYAELKAMGDFGEEDYQAVEQIFAAKGDSRGQWEAMYETYRLYPSRERAEGLSEMAVPLTEEECALLTEFGSLIPADRGALQDAYGALSAAMETPEWQEVFQLEQGVIPKRSVSRQDGDVWQVTQGAFERSVLHVVGDSFFYLLRSETSGGVILAGNMADQALNGGFTLCRYDTDGGCYLVLTGTMDGQHMTGDFQVTYDGVSYTGTLDGEGHVDTPQAEGAEGFIYAYDSEEQNCLQIENADPVSFVMDAGFWNLPEITVWPTE